MKAEQWEEKASDRTVVDYMDLTARVRRSVSAWERRREIPDGFVHVLRSADGG